MSDERRNEGGGAVIAIILVVLVIGLLGLVGMGVGGFIFYRVAQQRAVEAEMRALAQAELAHMQATLAQAEAEQAVAKAHAQLVPEASVPVATSEIFLQIDAAGAFTLENNPVNDDALQAALADANAAHPQGVKLKIQAHRETPFARVEQAMKAGKAAGITHQIVEQK